MVDAPPAVARALSAMDRGVGVDGLLAAQARARGRGWTKAEGEDKENAQAAAGKENALPPPPAPPKDALRQGLLKAKARLDAEAEGDTEPEAPGAPLVGPGPDCLHPLMQRSFPFLCAVCGRGEDLQTCSACQCVRFCGRTHQKMFWPQHKAFCGAWAGLHEGCGGQRFDDFVQAAVGAFETANARPPQPAEAHGLCQAPRCDACGAMPAVLKCDGCSMVGFCSEGCRSTGQAKHADVCAKMRHTTAVVQLLHEYGRGPGAVSTVCGPIATDSWASYLQEARVHLFGDSVQHAGPALRFAVQDSLSCPLVLLEGLRGAGRADAVNKPQAAVELIGASGYEFDAFMKWEELLHRCPNLQDLTVRMVGPEALVLSDGPSMDVSGDLCETCRRHGKTLVFECPEQATRYEDWTAPSTPDARAAFNCGFAEPAADYSWPAALAAVAAKADGVPLVFTSLTPMDGARDLQVALRAKLRVLAKPAEAAFASPLSLPDLWERAEQDGTAPAFAFNAVVGAVAAP